jgi:hypothetical protein
MLLWIQFGRRNQKDDLCQNLQLSDGNLSRSIVPEEIWLLKRSQTFHKRVLGDKLAMKSEAG